MDNSIYFDGRHHDALWPGLQRQNELEFYLRRIREFGEPVLELGCGTGQLTIALAKAGVNLTGLDLSEPILARARKKAVSQSITFHQKIGMELLGAANEAGIPVVKDYGGPGQDRVVFRRAISQFRPIGGEPTE